VPLGEIKKIIRSKNYDRAAALEGHLSALMAKRAQIDSLIANVEKTIAASKGEAVMHDNEKFHGFKQKLIEDNEKAFGAEIRAKYGDQAVDASNEKLQGLTRDRYEQAEELSRRINVCLKAAFEAGDPAGELAQEVCDMHRRWLSYFWKDYSSSPPWTGADLCGGSRFTAYYDEHAAPAAPPFFWRP
jgi:DNA-binding transcriptional MerR regulator